MSDVRHLSRLSYANISRILFAPLKKKVGKTLNCWNCRSYKKPVIRCHLKHDQTTYVVTGNSYSKKISFYDCFNGYFVITLWSWIAKGMKNPGIKVWINFLSGRGAQSHARWDGCKWKNIIYTFKISDNANNRPSGVFIWVLTYWGFDYRTKIQSCRNSYSLLKWTTPLEKYSSKTFIQLWSEIRIFFVTLI